MQTLDAKILIRATEKEKKQFTKAAQADGRSLSDWIRRTLAKAVAASAAGHSG